MSASSSIKIKAARSSETWINILVHHTAGYPIRQYSPICITMAHQIMAVVLRISKQTPIKSRFWYKCEWITYGGISNFHRYVKRQLRQKQLHHYLRLDQNDKLRIPTYQAEMESAIFIIHSQVKCHKIHTKYTKLQTHASQAILRTLKATVVSV
jgi:hypothetical protein